MKRTPMARGSGFKRPERVKVAPAPPTRATRPSSYAGTTGEAIAKAPADRLPALRRLAKGEGCCVCVGTACDPATTVWAHTNKLSDNKGMGYKASDSQGFFAGYQCHAMIDQGHWSAALIEALVAQAQARTTARLLEIAGSPTMKPWKIEAARWALARR